MSERPFFSSRLQSSVTRTVRGYTLLEVLIALVILAVILGALLVTMTRLKGVSTQQISITDVQQAARAGHEEVLRMVRMAGRGGLQQDRGVAGPALLVRNNVGSSGDPRDVVLGWPDAPEAVQDTDIVTVRGVLTSDLWAVDYLDPSTSTIDETTGRGSVRLRAVAPTGVVQDLSALIEAHNAGAEEALVLIDAIDSSTYGVAQLVIGAALDGSAPEVTIQFDAIDGRGAAYATLSRDFDGGATFPDLNAVAFVGILEEYRFYVRDDDELGPVLARARTYPGFEQPYLLDDDELEVDYARGVADLQIALGFDTSVLGAFADDDDAEGIDDEIAERAVDDGQADDWLYNQTADDPADALWTGPWLPDDPSATAPKPRLYVARISTLTIADRIERGHPSRLLPGLEDRLYSQLDDDPINGLPNRLKRKRLLQTVVKPRNLS